MLRVERLGPGLVTVKAMPLLARPPTVTTTLPVVAPLGTGTPMLVALQLAGDAAIPLNVTVLVPWVAPKLDPEMVTEVPTGPDDGLRFEIPGPAAPPPEATLKAANAAPQMSEAASDALVEALPAAV